jgi:hypothetical protein
MIGRRGEQSPIFILGILPHRILDKSNLGHSKPPGSRVKDFNLDIKSGSIKTVSF